MRIGILTNGGDCPGLNRGILDAARHIERAGSTPVLIAGGYGTLVEVGRGGDLATAVVDAHGIDCRLLVRSGGTFLRSSRLHVNDHVAAALDGATRLDLDAIVVFGGDGSLRGGTHLVAGGLVVAGAPKTIDNDIVETEQCIGFATAVQTGLDAVERVYDSARSHGTAFVVETMGRRSGILAAAIADAVGVDGLCVPERPIDLDRLVERLIPGAVVVVAEGAFGEGLGERPLDDKGRPVVGGVGATIVEVLGPAARTGLRSVSLGHVLRGGPPVAADRSLAGALGVTAASCALDRHSAIAVVRNGVVSHAPLTSHRRFLDADQLTTLGDLLV